MNWYRFFFGTTKSRRRPQTYRQYKKSRERRERYAAMYAAEHPKKTYQAKVTLTDGTVLECDHAHRSPEAAQACGNRISAQNPPE